MVKLKVIGLGFVFALFGLMAGSTAAQDPASVMVGAFLCPQEYSGSNWEADCEPLPDVEASIYLDASEYGFTEVTDANGQAFFSIEGDGPFVVELGVPGDFADFRSYCGVVGVPEPIQVENPNSNRMIVPLGAGLDVECSFFVLPYDAQGDVDEEPTGEVSVAELPNAGSGSVIDGHPGLSIVALLTGSAVLLAGVGLLTAREELFER